MSTTTITKTVFFNASRETVWSFLTEKDKLGEWYHPAESDLAEGQDYALFSVTDDNERKSIIWGRVIKMDSPRKLVTTFIIAPFQNNETTITWELEAAAGGTRLLLTHEGIAEAAGEAAMQLLSALDNGWDTHFSGLRNVIAQLSAPT